MADQDLPIGTVCTGLLYLAPVRYALTFSLGAGLCFADIQVDKFLGISFPSSRASQLLLTRSVRMAFADWLVSRQKVQPDWSASSRELRASLAKALAALPLAVKSRLTEGLDITDPNGTFFSSLFARSIPPSLH